MKKKKETGRCLDQTIDWLRGVISQKETTENPQCPVDWKRHDSYAGYLIFEQDLTSFYETRGLNLALDCRGNFLTWEMEFGFRIIKSFAMSQKLKISPRYAQQHETSRMIERKIL